MRSFYPLVAASVVLDAMDAYLMRVLFDVVSLQYPFYFLRGQFSKGVGLREY